MEFPTVCDAMLYFQSRTNLNIKTQVIGYGIGSKKDLVPQDGKNYVLCSKLFLTMPCLGDKCLWTEWFDHNDPCSSDGDDEVHSSHKSYLENSQTSTLRFSKIFCWANKFFLLRRICNPEDICDTQQQGGSEITGLPVDDLIRGLGHGFDIKSSFGQVLTVSNTSYC